MKPFTVLEGALASIICTEAVTTDLSSTRSHLRGLEAVSAGNDAKGDFYHGVASGSPLPDAMIFWTRYTPVDESSGDVEIQYRIAKVPENNGKRIPKMRITLLACWRGTMFNMVTCLPKLRMIG